jgi:glyoxylase-like metal-dependent hydrolase (beta-lactamase superfamily II)
MWLNFTSLMLATVTSAATTTCFSQTSTPTFAPIPPGAAGLPVNTTGYRIEAFGKGAYMLTDGMYQSMFFVACDSVIIVDAPPTTGHNLLNGIRTVTDLPISHVVYSHAHADHIGAAYLLDSKDVTFIAHEETAKNLAAINDTNRPTPSVTFSQDYDLNVCNQTLQLSYKGPNHEPGNIFIYAPIQKVLMLVDIVFPGWVPFDYLAESQNIPGFIIAHDQILEYQFDHYVGGHLNRAGTRRDVLNQQEYVTDLYNSCAEAIRLSGEPPSASNPLSAQIALAPVEAANPGNSWAIFEVYLHDDLASYCANKTISKWLGRLAGADVYGQSNALVMVESLRIDFGILGPFGVMA